MKAFAGPCCTGCIGAMFFFCQGFSEESCSRAIIRTQSSRRDAVDAVDLSCFSHWLLTSSPVLVPTSVRHFHRGLSNVAWEPATCGSQNGFQPRLQGSMACHGHLRLQCMEAPACLAPSEAAKLVRRIATAEKHVTRSEAPWCCESPRRCVCSWCAEAFTRVHCARVA